MSTCIYCRVSTQEQAKSGYSIPEQIARTKAYCVAMGWADHQMYVDAGHSGGSLDRPEIQRLIKDCSGDDPPERVLVYKLDRLSRSQKDTLYLIEDVFLDHGVSFVSMSENFDTSTPLGRAMVGLLSVFAQLEREQIRERTMMGLEARAKSGLVHGSGQSPIGYVYENGQLLPEPSETVLVKRMYELYDSGHGLAEIARILNATGILCRGGQWSRQTIRRVLDSRIYLGEVRFRDSWLPGKHVPLIASDLWESVHEKRERYLRTGQGRNTGQAAKFALTGLCVCGRCGAQVWSYYSFRKTKKPGTGGKLHYYKYACRNSVYRFKESGRTVLCDLPKYDRDELEKAVFDQVRLLSVDPESVIDSCQSETDSTTTEISSLKSEVQKLTKQISTLLDLYGTDGIPMEDLQRRISDLTARRDVLREEIDRIRSDITDIPMEELLPQISSIGEVLDDGDTREIRDLLSTLIDSIVLDGESVEIKWKFSTT